MVKLFLIVEIFLVVCFDFTSAFCDAGSTKSYSDSSCHQETQSNYMIIRYVIGSGGILGSATSDKIHSATAGETFVGFIQGNNNLLLSGYWHPALILTPVDEKAEAIPSKTFTLHQNYPNPFNPQTVVQYELPGDYYVNIKIFNVAGQNVRSLLDNEIQGPGTMEMIWNGLDDAGDMLSSGVYLCRIHCRSIEREKSNREKELQGTIKMLLVR